jgi:hypothetical protein
MKCFLHIGTEKTGTSTIQEFFSNNRIQLASRGYYYLESLGLPNNRFLPLAAFNSSRRDDFTIQLGLSSDDALTSFQRKIVLNFNNEIGKLPPDSTVICSSEHIQSRLTAVEEIERLKRILNDAHLSDISVIVYLRNPSETANSLCSTAIKSGYVTRDILLDIPRPDNEHFENICNHKKTVEKFASVFGKEKVIVRLFRRDKFINNSLIDDFSNIVGLDQNMEGLIVPVNQNESLSLLGMMILRNLNERIPLFDANGINSQRKDLTQLVSKYFSEPKFSMGKEFYEAFDSHFAESNLWIKENYFPEESELFSYDPPEASRLEIPENVLLEITNFIAEIWINRSNVLDDRWYNFGKKRSKQKFVDAGKYLFQKLGFFGAGTEGLPLTSNTAQ